MKTCMQIELYRIGCNSVTLYVNDLTACFFYTVYALYLYQTFNTTFYA